MRQVYFSSSDLKKYLTIEVYHLLDSYNLQETIVNYTENPGGNEGDLGQLLPRDFFELLADFYAFLPVLRYSTTIPDGNTGHKEYTENEYNEFVATEYRRFVDRANQLISKLFQNLASQIKFQPGFAQVDVDIDTLEATVIYHFYNLIVVRLDAVLTSYKSCAGANLKTIVQAQEDLIAQRFVMDVATQSEIYDPHCGMRVLLYKRNRYAGIDRASYWKKIISTQENKPFFNRVREIVERFLTEEESPFNPFIISFLLLLVTKYHIVLHRHARDEFRNLRQHINRVDVGNEVLERAQKVFTFTRLVVRYFPDIFVADSQEESRPVAKAIEILSYLRRGFAFELLEDPVKSFNDLTSAEKQTSVLRDEYGKRNKKFVALYQEVMVPYIYSLKGELYRKNFAFYNAHQYFCNAMSRFEESMSLGGRTEIDRLLDSSLRIPRTQVAKGKTFFQLGEFRKALKWYLKGLERLLNVLKLNQTCDFSDIFKYLEAIRLDPKLNKKALFDKLATLTEQIIKMVPDGDAVNVANYGVLLSDFVNRIGLLMLMFNLPDYDALTSIEKQYEGKNFLENLEKRKEEMCRNFLAGKWLILALRLNPWNSLSRFNELFFELESACDATWGKLENEKKRLGVLPFDNAKSSLMVAGEPRDIVYHLIAKRTLEFLRHRKERKEGEIENDGERIAKSLLQRLLLLTADFSTRNAELYKYLTKAGQLSDSDEIRFYVLRRWSSINPALPRPSAFKMKGGGYFVTFKKKGIAIDPGINFVENLYSEGFSVADVHFIISTHDHIDHIAEIDTILSLHYKRCKVDETEKRPLTLVLNPSVSARYGFLVNQDPGLFRKIELTTHGGRIRILDDLAVEPKPVLHRDICSPIYSNSIGLVLVFYPGNEENEYKIGIIGDTRWCEQGADGMYSGVPVSDQFLDADILIAHINGTPFRELKAYCKVALDDQELLNVLNEMDASGHAMHPLIQQFKYSLGYNIDDPVSKIFDAPGQLDAELTKLDGEHMFLHGILETYKKFADTNSNRRRLFIIGETNEEMGSYRHKVAKLLNRLSKKSAGPKCMTGDIGMAIRVKPLEKNPERIMEVRCSRCNLNNDYMDDDKFHSIGNINEVCIKWEEDGLMYYCRRHDPETVDRKITDYGFAERIERYQPLRHIDIRIR